MVVLVGGGGEATLQHTTRPYPARGQDGAGARGAGAGKVPSGGRQGGGCFSAAAGCTVRWCWD